jgi:hypothetical protein
MEGVFFMASKMQTWEVFYVRKFYSKISGISTFEGSWSDSITIEATTEEIAKKKADSKLKGVYGKGGITYYNEWEISHIKHLW